MQKPIFLGVNIDHVATLRQARKTRYPEPVEAAFLAIAGGADSITVHLREDARHIQARDVLMLKEALAVKLNLEMANTLDMVEFALEVEPGACCFVPEKREELTTEGGLDVKAHFADLKESCQRLNKKQIWLSLFVDPDLSQIEAAKQVGAQSVEIHTGQYADAGSVHLQKEELARIKAAAEYAHSLGLVVHAGHGLHYSNVMAIAKIAEIEELNIGHAIVARAVLYGMERAVREMKTLLERVRT